MSLSFKEAREIYANICSNGGENVSSRRYYR